MVLNIIGESIEIKDKIITSWKGSNEENQNKTLKFERRLGLQKTR